jgi:hypothetical protein
MIERSHAPTEKPYRINRSFSWTLKVAERTIYKPSVTLLRGNQVGLITISL